MHIDTHTFILMLIKQMSNQICFLIIFECPGLYLELLFIFWTQQIIPISLGKLSFISFMWHSDISHDPKLIISLSALVYISTCSLFPKHSECLQVRHPSYFWALWLIQVFMWNKTMFTKYCLTQWLSKLPGSFENHWLRQYLVNLMGLVGMVNATVYETEPIMTVLGHGKLS